MFKYIVKICVNILVKDFEFSFDFRFKYLVKDFEFSIRFPIFYSDLVSYI